MINMESKDDYAYAYATAHAYECEDAYADKDECAVKDVDADAVSYADEEAKKTERMTEDNIKTIIISSAIIHAAKDF